jgi:hypothetical protein
MHIEGDDDVNQTDQDTLSAEEMALEAQMRADGDGNPEDDGKPVVPEKPAKPAKPAKAATKAGAAAKPEGEGEEEEGEEGAEGAVEGADGKGAKKGTVPHAALHEERELRKQAQAALIKTQEEHAAQMTKAMERFERALQAFAPKEPVPEPVKVPDFETDPAGWIAHTMQSQGKSLEQVQGELKAMKDEREKAQTANTENAKNQAVVKEIFDYAVEKENVFKAANPDYDAASAFLLQSRKEELAELGYPEKQIAEMINVERLTIAHQAKQNSKDPAEIVYNLARRRGYAKKETPAADGQQQQQQPTGAERIEAARKGTEQAQGLGGERGTPANGLTAARLLEMSDAEFDRAMATKEGRALMGS